ncbi:YeeE/YedE thiosulfate transporter family protein [Candidatus Magnetominusculus xianensis]|uniref:YeeE/YedE family protein n=1 Tax=Candidatus Magnetominusculus xianensis TaxID=1748249 RepID=A0ABR5SCW5_9BACT|nr:YeeE/YedE thiosulfate transporter family protein [Candidatus Magnetominusculus xianensis]KWT76853.1 YeeE/YedE family protein [Candidatus Magnetominusculus xianensis]MBF0402641.1 YeeE/YedE family protein [Nitrospirota bacterium]
MIELITFNEFLGRLAQTFDASTIEAVKGPTSLYGGLILGLLFGIVLQKARLCKYDIVSGLFRLQDFTVFRVGTPILMVSVVLIFIFKDTGVFELHVPKTVIVPQIIGGLLFGAGIAIMGYCPGTAAGALGEGSLDAIPSILGMISGAVLYAEFFHDSWENTFLKWGAVGGKTFFEILNINHWYLIVLFLLMLTMFLIATTMFDIFIVFLRRTFNLFMELTDALEEKVPPATKPYAVSTLETVRKFRQNLRDLFK